MTDVPVRSPFHPAGSALRRQRADQTVAEAAAAYSAGSGVFVTRVEANRIDAIEQAGWRLEHITDGRRPARDAGSVSVFCVFVRADASS